MYGHCIFNPQHCRKLIAAAKAAEELETGISDEKPPAIEDDSETKENLPSSDDEDAKSNHSSSSSSNSSKNDPEDEPKQKHKFKYKEAKQLMNHEAPLEEYGYWWTLLYSCIQPAMLLLFLTAAVRHAGGYSLSYNTQLYIEEYYPDVNPGLWLAMDSIIGGSFGVFFGGWFSDIAVKRFGLYSRLWILAVFLVRKNYH